MTMREGLAEALPHKGKLALPEFIVCHKSCDPLVVIKEDDSRVGDFSKFEGGRKARSET